VLRDVPHRYARLVPRSRWYRFHRKRQRAAAWSSMNPPSSRPCRRPDPGSACRIPGSGQAATEWRVPKAHTPGDHRYRSQTWLSSDPRRGMWLSTLCGRCRPAPRSRPRRTPPNPKAAETEGRDGESARTAAPDADIVRAVRGKRCAPEVIHASRRTDAMDMTAPLIVAM
jgi:hypothetical protein